MAYEKQNFMVGQVLKAEHLNHMEDGIAALAMFSGDGYDIEGSIVAYDNGTGILDNIVFNRTWSEFVEMIQSGITPTIKAVYRNVGFYEETGEEILIYRPLMVGTSYYSSEYNEVHISLTYGDYEPFTFIINEDGTISNDFVSDGSE